MAVIRIRSNLSAPMAFFIDVESADVDLTTVSGGSLVLTRRRGQAATRTWSLTVVAETASTEAVRLRHDFSTGDTDLTGDFSLLLLLDTPAGQIPKDLDDVIEIYG